jgi:NADH dehydrogenase
MAGCDAVINLVGIIKEDAAHGVTFEKLHWEGSRNAIDAAKAVGVKRFVQMSANGVKPHGTGYQTTKYRAEEYLKGSGLDWTIFRPSVIFGETHGRMNFVTELAGPLKMAPAFPIFGDGKFPMQPVHVEDVAEAFVRALTTEASIGKTYCQGGPQSFTYKEVVAAIAEALGRPGLPLIPVPLPFVQLGVGFGEHLPGFPITADQLTMLVEGNACVDMAWAEDLGITPKAFNAKALGFLTRPEPEMAVKTGRT